MVDKAKVDQIISNLRAYRSELGKLSQTPKCEFLTDSDKVGSAKYHFVVAIECCIDIANHIISREGLDFPESNVEGFEILIENGWLPESMRNRLAAMAKFRNRLVHLYWKIDDEKVYEYLDTCLGDFDDYVAEILENMDAD